GLHRIQFPKTHKRLWQIFGTVQKNRHTPVFYFGDAVSLCRPAQLPRLATLSQSTPSFIKKGNVRG
ncbi:MAG: hypothetical protein IKL95_01375, partial [Alphaproteobacteria bacterium]|nr:hypothetical protein [Alphaproteobacteria bacterium]